MGGIDHEIWRSLEVLELIYGRVKLGQRRFLTSSYGRVKRKGSKLLSIRFPPETNCGVVLVNDSCKFFCRVNFCNFHEFFNKYYQVLKCKELKDAAGEMNVWYILI